ncbi:flavoprotein [Guptibacillus hwajinpoensis]|uniref:Flavoprotein n=1 Tax=Guptibacillus hwajinpoensis TaxID=208199 RepID=A0ABU0K2Z9_9BACL|nr:flavoprotein [Alkalihalobacillus hemicentroti]MDQ0483738.1 hypothetical protein [Alkalihalobacillus hemicentroti]
MSGFQEFLDDFLTSWHNCSLDDMKYIINDTYQAREVSSQSELYDFGYEESIEGWDQAFTAFKNDESSWVLKKLAVTPIRRNEMLAIIFATIESNGKQSDTGNVFFNTFRKGAEGNWKLVRSYIEAGVSIDYVDQLIKE